MPSRLIQRIIIITGIVLGGYLWTLAVPVLRAADGSNGVSLMSATINPLAATLTALLAGLPAAGMVVVAAAWGRINAGMFIAAAALAAVAVAGGPINGWMWRSELPGGYIGLIIEMLIWQAAIVGLWFAGQKLRMPLQRRMTDPPEDTDEVTGFGQTGVMSMLVSAGAAMFVAWFLLRTSESGQVIGALVAAFAAGGFASRSLFPRATPLAVYLSPAIVAVIGYALVLMRFTEHDQVLSAWYHVAAVGQTPPTKMPPTAMALPIHFASAGLAGCTIGVSLGRGDDEQPGNALSALWRTVREVEGDEVAKRS